MEALSLVGLQRYAMSMPSQLSGGMQQRVGLARALASDPSILLMDEAFSALDPLIRRQMQDELMAIQQQLKKTILFITHDLNEASESAIGCALCGRSSGADRYARRDPDEACIGLWAEFVQDVDQGRVIEVQEVMVEPAPITATDSLANAVRSIEDRAGVFVLDAMALLKQC